MVTSKPASFLFLTGSIFKGGSDTVMRLYESDEEHEGIDRCP